MPTIEQILARLNALYKEYEDDPESIEYQALRHAFLFISYNMASFKQYLQEVQKKEE